MLIKNAKLSNGSLLDLLIKDGKINKISDKINIIESNILDLKGEYFISPGWIDGHAHAFNMFEFIGDEIDELGIKSGVTTLIDAGTVGANNIRDFRNANIKATSDVFSLLNISKIGIIKQDELSNLDDLDHELFINTYNEYKDIICGIKARMSGSCVGKNGIKPLIIAKEIQKDTKLPLMVHIGNPEPDLDDILKLLGKNDVLTHCLHEKQSNIFYNSKNTFNLLNKALKKGLILDIGHGTSSFSYNMYEKSKEANLDIDIISTDIYRNNRKNGPVFNFAITISKFLNLGMSHEDIIKKITINPASVYNLKDRGSIEEGLKADLTIYKIVDDNIDLMDSEGNVIIGQRMFKPFYVIKDGNLIEIGE